MQNCNHCGKLLTDELASQLKLCPHCGQPLVVADERAQKPVTIAYFPDRTIDLGTSERGQFPPTSSDSAGNQQTFIHDSTIQSGQAESAKPQTVADLPSTNTVDLSVASPPSASHQGDNSQQTIDHDSTSLSAAAQLGYSVDPDLQGKPKTVSDRQFLATMDSASEIDLKGKLKALWGEKDAPASPYVTMHGHSQLGRQPRENSTLVIRERALRDKEHQHIPIADYELIEVLGQGGMGVVYTARQSSVDREVALKMLHPEMLKNPNQRRKFLSEAVVTGELDHPNIVPIYDVGQNAEGSLFYSMKKVQGTPWSKLLPTKSLLENLDILLKVADAVAFAHARGVIHRDLKPENVMLGDYGEVLVLDWGLAVATEGHRPTPNVATDFGIAGTPAYMSPELAMGSQDLIGPTSDLYLLGAILYEIITGKPPHQGNTAIACMMAAARNEIVPTEKRGELVEIARQAMRTNVAERFPSVQAFQQAIRDYQSHSESISLAERAQQDLKSATSSDDYREYARALLGFEEAYKLWDGNETAWAGISRAKVHYAYSAYRKRDFDLGLSIIDHGNPDHAEIRQLLLAGKRDRDAHESRLKKARRVMLALAAAVFIAISVGIVLTTVMKFEADKQRDLAQEQKAEADKQRLNAENQEKFASEQRDEALRQEQLAIAARRQAEYEAYVALISMASAKINENAFGQAAQALSACQENLRGWEWGRLSHVIHQGAGKQFTVPARVECLAANPDGTKLAAGARDGVVRLWELGGNAAGRIVYQAEDPKACIHALAFSPSNPNLLAIGTNREGQLLQLLDVTTGKLRVLSGAQGHRGAVVQATFSRDGTRLLTASHDHTAKLWNIASGEPVVTYQGHSWLVWSAIFSLDAAEKFVATASEDGTVRIWDTATGKEWSSRQGEPIPFTGHQGPVYSLAFLPANRPAAENVDQVGEFPDIGFLASAGYDKRILMWQPHELLPFDYKKLLADEPVPQTPFVEFTGHTAAVRQIAFSPDGSKLLSASNDNSLRVWYARDEDLGYAIARRGLLKNELRGHDGPVQAALFLPQHADEIASAGFDNTVRMWNLSQYQEERTLPAQALRGHLDSVMAGRFSSSGQYIYTASRDRTAKKWSLADSRELTTYREGHAYLTSKAIYYPGGERLLTAAVDGTVRVWEVRTGAELLKITGTGYRATAALSRDGKWILTGSDTAVLVTSGGDQSTARREGAILWDANTGERVRVFAGHKVPLTAVAISDNGALVFTGDENGVGQLWNTDNGEHVAKLEFHLGPIMSACFTPDGKRLLTASVDKSVCQWDLGNSAQPAPLTNVLLKHSATVNTMALTADGTCALTGDDDGHTTLWDLANAKPLWQVGGRSTSDKRDDNTGSINAVAISPKAGESVALTVDAEQHIVRLLDLKTGRELLSPHGDNAVDHFLSLRSKDAFGWSAAFSPDGSHIVTVGGDEARLWDRQGVEAASFGPHRPLTFVGLSKDDKLLVTAGWDNTARLWNTDTGAALITLDGNVAGNLGAHNAVINSAVFSPDGARLLTASDDGTLRIWDAKTGHVQAVLRSPYGGVTKAYYLRQGRQILAAFRGGVSGAIAGIWNAEGLNGSQALPAPLIKFQGHTSSVLDIALSPDERFVVTGSADHSARLWDTTTGQQLLSLDGHSGEVSAVAFSPDLRQPRVLTGSADRTAKLWDVSAVRSAVTQTEMVAAKELLTLRGHTRGVTSTAFSPDGQTALTTGRDGISILWAAETWRSPAGAK